MSLTLDNIAPLSAPTRAGARRLLRERGRLSPRHPTRRGFIKGAALSGAAVGALLSSSAIRASRAAAAPPADADDINPADPDGCPGISPNFYANNGAKPCGPSWICNGSPFLGGCADGVWHRQIIDLPNGDAWKYRRNECPPSTIFDGWKWDQDNYAGCATARVLCHDGFKVVDFTPLKSIRAGFVACV